MGVEEICNTGLSLGLGSVGHTQKNQLDIDHQQDKRSSYKSDNIIFPSLLTLGLSSELTNQSDPTIQAAAEQPATLCRQVSSLSVVSSFSNSTSSTVKRERDVSGEEVEVEKFVVVSSSNKVDHDQDEEFGARKKLRLTKDQSLILEESFKEHSTLNPKQKQVLAKRLNLRARQVEVWFQNRRARTKLKQTEVDCEMLKKCCETLTEENRRLQKEVQELKALKNITSSTPPPLPFYMQVSAATITMCPSCERISTTNSTSSTVTETSSSKSPPAFSSNPHFNYTSSTTTTTTTLTHPSAPSYTTSLKTS